MDDLKAIKLTTGIGTLDSCVIFQPLEKNCCVHAPTGRPLSAHSEKGFETQHRYYESNYAFDVTLLICNVYIFDNLFTTYTNYVCATFIPIVQEYRECDIRRLRDNGVFVFFGKRMSMRKRDIAKAGGGLR